MAGGLPGTPRVFRMPVGVESADIDRLRHVNNIVYLRWALEAARAHWEELSSEAIRAEVVWVVRRHNLEYLKPAFADDDLEAVTWVEAASGATCTRRVEILRHGEPQPLMVAITTWVAVDAGTGRPRRMDDRLKRLFCQP
ncbi:MAG: acyl-CoA thioesterase [Armatimonadetes bacterium]|nr:acyl-CoA thioesterase [Armatimonadota bacterium]MDE2207694.1 acyl-CoA thioesterase [Armatimonadota bacterium]